MLITLKDIRTQPELAEVLEHPAKQKDCVLYVTEKPDVAKQLIKSRLPCIFLEESPCGIYGADMTISREKNGKSEKSGGQDTDDGGWNWRTDEDFLEKIWRRHYRLPWTVAVTERLVIRETVPEDLPDLLEIYNGEADNKDVKPFSEQPEEELCSYIKFQYGFYGYGVWTILERSTGNVMGRIGFEKRAEEEAGDAALELQYLIGGEFRRQGYAKEAALAALAYAKEELGTESVMLRTSSGNTASRKLAESLGMRCEERESDNNKPINYRLNL